MEFLEACFTQVLVSEVWEELWGLESNRPRLGLDSWGRSGQVLVGLQALAWGQGSGPFPQAPSRGLWCPAERRELLRPIRQPRLGLVWAVSAALVVLVAWVVSAA